MMEIQCAVDVASRYGIELIREGNCYRAACPVCGKPHLTLAPSKRFSGYYFACNCYSQGGHQFGSGTNLDFWLRSLGATGAAEPVYISTASQPARPATTGLLPKVAHGAAARLRIGSNGTKYLAARGITLETARAWRLGYGFWCKYENESIVIPWYSPDHELVAVSHRLIKPTEDQPKAPWHSGMAGKTAGLLCGWHTHQSRPALVIVEGVINAISIYQALGDLVDVLTPGSENTNPATWDMERLRQWDRVIAWADKPEVAARWTDAINAQLSIYSIADDVKTDANDLLKCGQLRNFLEDDLR